MARMCPSCGQENADDVDFCAGCGGYLRWEPTRAATPAVPPPAPPPPAPAAPPAAAAPPPAQPPVQPAPAAPAPPPPQAQPAQAPPPPPQPQAQPAPPPPQPPLEPQEEPKKRRWGRKKVPGVAGGGVSGPRVSGPRVQAPRVNVGPGGVNVAGPKVQAPRVAPPRAAAPRLKQPKVPTSPKGFMDAFKKVKVPGGGGGGGRGGGSSGAVTDGPVAPQPVETWHWDAVGQESGGGKGRLLLVFLLLLLLGGAAAGGWWFFVREDDGAAPAQAASTATTETFVSGLQPLLVRSARDRVRISRAVTGVAACSLAPGPAAQQIGQTIAGRRAVLAQVRRVKPPNAAIRRVRRMLEQSLVLSAAAGREYSLWIASFNGACPARTGPEYTKAIATNRRAQASKVAFARAYNPIAKSVGARTWKSTQF